MLEKIEILNGGDDREDIYERAKRQALALLDQGFYLGGVIPAARDEWHER